MSGYVVITIALEDQLIAKQVSILLNFDRADD